MTSCDERVVPGAPTRATKMKRAHDRVKCPTCGWFVPRTAEQAAASIIPTHAGM